MHTAKLITRGRRQFVELPEDCRFEGPEVCVARFGDIVMLFPPGKEWNVMEKSLGQFTDDFMANRNQPKNAGKRTRL